MFYEVSCYQGVSGHRVYKKHPQILFRDSLIILLPQFCHLPLVLSTDGVPLGLPVTMTSFLLLLPLPLPLSGSGCGLQWSPSPTSSPGQQLLQLLNLFAVLPQEGVLWVFVDSRFVLDVFGSVGIAQGAGEEEEDQRIDIGFTYL